MTDSLPIMPLSDRRRQELRSRVMFAAANPRTQHRQRAVKVMAAAAAAAATAVGFVLTTAGPAAAWTPRPAALTGAPLATAKAHCLSDLTAHGGVYVAELTGEVRTLIGERRGSTTSVFMTGPHESGYCAGGSRSHMSGIVPMDVPAPTSAIVIDGSPGIVDTADAVRVVFGRVPTGSATVVIQTGDARTVTASVADGRFFAWWPSGADPLSVTAFDATGATLGTIRPEPTGSVSNDPSKATP